MPRVIKRILIGLLAVIAVVAIFACAQLLLRWRSLDRGYDLGFDLVELLHHRYWHRGIATAERAGMLLTGMTAGSYLAVVTNSGHPGGDGLIWFGVAAGLGLPIVLRRRLPGELLILVALGLALVLVFAVFLSGG